MERTADGIDSRKGRKTTVSLLGESTYMYHQVNMGYVML